MNTARKMPEAPIAEVSMLSLVQTSESLQQESVMCQALIQIREMLNSKRRNPAHIFNNTLSQKQRETLCFAAGLKRTDTNKPFNELDEDARISIKKAILMFGQVFSCFAENQALENSKFLKIKG